MQAARSKKSTGTVGRPPPSHVVAEKEKVKEKTEKGKEQKAKVKSVKAKEQNVKTKTKKSELKEKTAKVLDTDMAMEDESKDQVEEMKTQKCEAQEGNGKDTDMVMEDETPPTPAVSATGIYKDLSLPPVVVSEVPSITDCVAHLTKKQFDFDPGSAAFWKSGEHVPFVFLAHAFDSKSAFALAFHVIQ